MHLSFKIIILLLHIVILVRYVVSVCEYLLFRVCIELTKTLRNALQCPMSCILLNETFMYSLICSFLFDRTPCVSNIVEEPCASMPVYWLDVESSQPSRECWYALLSWVPKSGQCPPIQAILFSTRCCCCVYVCLWYVLRCSNSSQMIRIMNELLGYLGCVLHRRIGYYLLSVCATIRFDSIKPSNSYTKPSLAFTIFIVSIHSMSSLSVSVCN